MKEVFLKKDKERSVSRKHPWIYSGAVGRCPDLPENGECVRVLDLRGNFLAYASWSNTSSIALRIWSFQETEPVDKAFFEQKIRQAYELRKIIFHGTLPEAYRLIHGESDHLPGVIVDVYKEYAVLALSTAGVDRCREWIAASLFPYAPGGIYERSDVDSRAREGLECVCGVLRGDPVPEKILFREGDLLFNCHPVTGHKTGFYLDQRENRALLQRETVSGCSVLNCFSYTGGFGLAALAGGAQNVINVDSSAPALALAEEHARINGFTQEQFRTECADVFQYLRKCRDAGKSFDMIVLDPPKLAESFAHREKAARAYKDLNLLGMKLLKKGGKLFTFSCSGAMEDDLFGKVIASAAQDANADFRIVRRMIQGPDHPVSSRFPEGHYLKGIYGIKVS